MPKSSKPRKKYQRPDWAAEANRQRAKTESVHKPSEIPAAAHEVPTPPPAQARVARGRYVVPAAIGAGVIGGGAYLLHRRRRNAVSKTLINPLTGEAVVVEKCYPIEDEVAKSASTKAVRTAAYRAKYGFQAGRAGGAHDEMASRFSNRVVRGSRRVGQASRGVTSDRALFGAGGVAVGAALPRKKVEKALRRPGRGKVGFAAGLGAGYGFDRLSGGHARRKAGREAFSDPRVKRYDDRIARLESSRNAYEDSADPNSKYNRDYGRLEDQAVNAHHRATGNIMRRNEHAKIKKAGGGCFVPGGVITDFSTGTGSTWERGGTSHANKLTHKTHQPRQKPRGTLLQVKHGGRRVSGSTVGKMYSETGRGVGKRLVEVQ